MGKPLSISELHRREELKRQTRADRQRERDNARAAREHERDEAREEREEQAGEFLQAAATSAQVLAMLVSVHQTEFSTSEATKNFDQKIHDLETFVDSPEEFDDFLPDNFYSKDFEPKTERSSERDALFLIGTFVVLIIGLAITIHILPPVSAILSAVGSVILFTIKEIQAERSAKKHHKKQERRRQLQLMESNKLREQEWQEEKILFDKEALVAMAKRGVERKEHIQIMEAAKAGDLASIKQLIEIDMDTPFCEIPINLKCTVASKDELHLNIIAPNKGIVPTHSLKASPKGRSLKQVEISEEDRSTIYHMFLCSFTLLNILGSFHSYPFWSRLKITVSIPTMDAGTGLTKNTPFITGVVSPEQLDEIVFENAEAMPAAEALGLRCFHLSDKTRICDAA